MESTLYRFVKGSKLRDGIDKSGGGIPPLLECFIKQSSQLNPVKCDKVSTQRKAWKPSRFKDGTRKETGQWICSPLASMSLDPRNHARPDEFHGFHFVEPDILSRYSADFLNHTPPVPAGEKPSQFTDISGIPVWGAGKMTCGGRFYASSAIKTLLGLFLTKWDFHLEDRKAKQHFAWRSWIYPYAGTKVIARPRA